MLSLAGQLLDYRAYYESWWEKNNKSKAPQTEQLSPPTNHQTKKGKQSVLLLLASAVEAAASCCNLLLYAFHILIRMCRSSVVIKTSNLIGIKNTMHQDQTTWITISSQEWSWSHLQLHSMLVETQTQSLISRFETETFFSLVFRLLVGWCDDMPGPFFEGV